MLRWKTCLSTELLFIDEFSFETIKRYEASLFLWLITYRCERSIILSTTIK